METDIPKDVILETTSDAIRMGKSLLRTARHGALATLAPETGWPIATRVGVGTDFDETPVILISGLSTHTRALRHDARCTLMVGTPGRGDPLAHARISVMAEARETAPDSAEWLRIAGRYLSHQPKAELYAGLGDFRYYRLEPQGALLYGGFGKTFSLTAAELLNTNPAEAELSEAEFSAIAHMNEDHAEAVSLYAEHYAKAQPGRWRLVGVDAEGMDLADGDEVRRVWFDTELASPEDMHKTLVRMAGEARRALNRPLRDARVAS